MVLPRQSLLLRQSLASRLGAIAPRRWVSSKSTPLPRTIVSLLNGISNIHVDLGETKNSTVANGEGEMAPSVVTVHGWIRSVRRMKNVSFAHIADGSTTMPLQAVLTKEQSEG